MKLTLRNTVLVAAVPAAILVALSAFAKNGESSSGKTSPDVSPPSETSTAVESNPVFHRTVEIDGQSVFYREAGPKDAPPVLLLHGFRHRFPTSSHIAVTEVTSEKLRDVTWVIIDEVKSGHWGVEGSALGLEDLKNIMAGD